MESASFMISATLSMSMRQRLFVLSKFISVQLIVQAIGLVSGILLVRSLSQSQYAYYTIVNTMQGTMNLLADSGISIGLISIGGKVWQDPYRFGQLINTAMRLRRALVGVIIVIIVPILIWVLTKQGASWPYAILLTLGVLTALGSQMTTGVLEVVPRLHSQVSRLQNLGLINSVFRLVALIIAYCTLLNAAIAVFIGSFSLMINNLFLRRWAAEMIDIQAPAHQEDRRDILRIMRLQAPNSVFYCFQGQITIWLISIFGKAQNVAEVGALGRLAMILAIVGTVMANIVAPGFAKVHSRERLLQRYLQVIASFGMLAVIVILITVTFPKQMLWLLGKNYNNLNSELVIVMLGSLFNGFLGVVWALNSAKGWIKYAWLYIPLTILAQALLLLTVDVSSTKGIITFSALSVLPNIFLNLALSYLGFRDMRRIEQDQRYDLS